MSDFKPFDNDSQALTLCSEDDELNLENGTDVIVLPGTLTIDKHDPDSRANVEELHDALSKILETL